MKIISQHVKLPVKFLMTLKEVLYCLHEGPSSLGGDIPSRHPDSIKQLPNLAVFPCLRLSAYGSLCSLRAGL